MVSHVVPTLSHSNVVANSVIPANEDEGQRHNLSTSPMMSHKRREEEDEQQQQHHEEGRDDDPQFDSPLSSLDVTGLEEATHESQSRLRGDSVHTNVAEHSADGGGVVDAHHTPRSHDMNSANTNVPAPAAVEEDDHRSDAMSDREDVKAASLTDHNDAAAAAPTTTHDNNNNNNNTHQSESKRVTSTWRARALYQNGREWQESRDRHVAAQREALQTQEMARCTFAPALTRRRTTLARADDDDDGASKPERTAAESTREPLGRHERPYMTSSSPSLFTHNRPDRTRPSEQRWGLRQSHEPMEKVGTRAEERGPRTTPSAVRAPEHVRPAPQRRDRRGRQRGGRAAVTASNSVTSSSSSGSSMTSLDASSSCLSSSLLFSSTSSSEEEEEENHASTARHHDNSHAHEPRSDAGGTRDLSRLRPPPRRSNRLGAHKGAAPSHSKDILFLRPELYASHHTTPRLRPHAHAPITQHSERDALRYLRTRGAARTRTPRGERGQAHERDQATTNRPRVSLSFGDGSVIDDGEESASSLAHAHAHAHPRASARRSMRQFLDDVAQDMQRRASHLAELRARHDIPHDAEDRLYESLTGRPLFQPNAMPTLEVTAGRRVGYADLPPADRQRLRDALREKHMESILREYAPHTRRHDAANGPSTDVPVPHTGEAAQTQDVFISPHEETIRTREEEEEGAPAAAVAAESADYTAHRTRRAARGGGMRDTLARMAHAEEQSRARRARNEAVLTDEQSRHCTFQPQLSPRSVVLARRRTGAKPVNHTDTSSLPNHSATQQVQVQQELQHAHETQSPHEGVSVGTRKNAPRGTARAGRKTSMTDMLTRSAAWQNRRAQQLCMARAEQSAREMQECVFVPQCAAVHLSPSNGRRGRPAASWATAFSSSSPTPAPHHADDVSLGSTCAQSSTAPKAARARSRPLQRHRRQLDILAASADVRLMNEVNQLHTQLAAVPEVQMWRASARCGLAGAHVKPMHDAHRNGGNTGAAGRAARARSSPGRPDPDDSACRRQPSPRWRRGGVDAARSASPPTAHRLVYEGGGGEGAACGVRREDSSRERTPRGRVAWRYGGPAYASTPPSAASSPMSEPHMARPTTVPVIRYLTRDEDVEEGHAWSALDAQTDAILRQF